MSIITSKPIKSSPDGGVALTLSSLVAISTRIKTSEKVASQHYVTVLIECFVQRQAYVNVLLGCFAH